LRDGRCGSALVRRIMRCPRFRRRPPALGFHELRGPLATF
jgi:hypothetical protein